MEPMPTVEFATAPLALLHEDPAEVNAFLADVLAHHDGPAPRAN